MKTNDAVGLGLPEDTEVACAYCERLRARTAELEAQIRDLEAQLGFGSTPNEITFLMQRFDLTQNEAKILLRLHRVCPRFLPTSTLEGELRVHSPGNLKVAVYKLRSKLGEGAVVSMPGAGYRLAFPANESVRQTLADCAASAEPALGPPPIRRRKPRTAPPTDA